MSVELPFFEAQIDAFLNTVWWTLDEKFGRTARPKVRENPTFLTDIIDGLVQIWDSVVARLSIAFFTPYILRYIGVIKDPMWVSLRLGLFCIVWPWIYQIFIYVPFLDPLRHLPGPKVSNLPFRN